LEKAGLAPAFLFAFQRSLLPAAAIARRLLRKNAARSNKPLMV
jgi:hypothetical protein